MPNLAATFRVPDQSKLLLLDTCGSETTIAVARGNEILEQVALPGRSASEGLVGAIGDVLRGVQWRLRDLDAVAIVRGPGSFTGIRVGLSAAKALVEASGRPLIAVSRLAVLATKAPAAAIAVLDAGRGEVFWAPVFETEVGEQAIAPMAWVAEHAHTLKLPVIRELRTGTEVKGIDVYEVPALTAGDALPLVLQRLLQGQTDDPLLLDGLYLHRTEQETLARQRSHRKGSVNEAASR